MSNIVYRYLREDPRLFNLEDLVEITGYAVEVDNITQMQVPGDRVYIKEINKCKDVVIKNGDIYCIVDNNICPQRGLDIVINGKDHDDEWNDKCGCYYKYRKVE